MWLFDEVRLRSIKLCKQGKVANESGSYVATVCSECMRG